VVTVDFNSIDLYVITSTFFTFFAFLSKSKKRDVLRLVPCFIRFLEQCSKTGPDNTTPSNFHPVSNLSFLYIQGTGASDISTHIRLSVRGSEHNLFPPFRSAYKKFHSTEELLKVFLFKSSSVELHYNSLQLLPTLANLHFFPSSTSALLLIRSIMTLSFEGQLRPSVSRRLHCVGFNLTLQIVLNPFNSQASLQ